MNNSCICAPVHQPKFNWGRQFVESYNKYFDDDHIFLVFSNQKEADIFKQENNSLAYRSIIFDGPEYVGPTINNPTITLKKWHGLNTIYKTTDMKYVGVVDTDSCFIAGKNYTELFDNYYTNKTIYGHYTKAEFVTKMYKGFTIPFTEEQQRGIDKIALNEKGVLYFWFNDIPVYERNDFRDFQESMNKDAKIYFHTFDYMSYGYFLLLSNKFKLHNFEDAVEVMSSIGEGAKDEKYFKIFQPMWLRKTLSLTDEVALKNVFMNFHLDRVPVKK